MWQSSKAHPAAYCPPGRGFVVCHVYRGRCPRLLMVVPSRHRSACGIQSVVEQKHPEDREGLSLFIALRWMQEPCGVMMGVAENIQACLRIFRRTQHQWLARDILHPSQGVYSVFVLHPVSASKSAKSVLSVVE